MKIKKLKDFTRKGITKMELSEFNYYLPEELIAQTPIAKRDESRLMVLDRDKRTIENKTVII